jgi:hypothetical protein
MSLRLLNQKTEIKIEETGGEKFHTVSACEGGGHRRGLLLASWLDLVAVEPEGVGIWFVHGDAAGEEVFFLFSVIL